MPQFGAAVRKPNVRVSEPVGPVKMGSVSKKLTRNGMDSLLPSLTSH